MTGLVALTSGSAAETTTYADPRFAAHLAGIAYTGPAAAASDLTAVGSAGAVWVPEGTPRRRMHALAPRLDAVLARGGAVLLFGDHQSGWPGSVRWHYRPAGGAGETEVGGAWAGTEVGAAARELHHHGVLDPPPGAEVLLATPDGAAVAYLDGTLLVSTVDPLAHFGHSGHAPAARFLEAFLPWVHTALTPRGDLS
ncbi:hypothetical protein ACVGOW_16595 [Pseudonocardia saturnea]